MVSVVVMAGYQSSEIEDYKRQLKYYHEKYTEKGYKALKEFKVRENGRLVKRPLIEFILRKVDDIFDVRDVVVVGDKARLEEKLGDQLTGSKKKYRLIDQNEPLTEELIQAFRLDPKRVAYNSICGNTIKGYAATEAYERGEHALFLAADSPKTQKNTIDEFITTASDLAVKENAALIYPLVSMRELPKWRKCFHRKYLFLVNDTSFKFDNSFTTWITKREGFRISSMVYANPLRINMNIINDLYSMRKMVSSEVRKRIRRLLEKTGHMDLWQKYLVEKKLTISETEKTVGALLECAVKALPIRDMGSTYDYDGTASEEDAITKILQEE